MTSPTTTPDLSNPFPGLRCFLSEEDYLFFGRHEQIENLLRRLRTNRLVAVVGTSGSGKSSLVRAGLLPAVLGGGMAQAGSNWEIAVMRPGGSPLAHLALALCEAGLYDADAEDALFHLQATLSRSRNGLVEAVRQSRAAGSRLLLVVDQFEELFRFNRAGTTSQEEAIGFVNLLLHATQQADEKVYVVLTMRSDFLGECSQFLGLAEAVNDGEFLIPRMTRDQIQEAIEGPIRVRGAAIAPRLLFRLLNDVQDDQDQLPVLQHALMRTWDLWQRGQPSGVTALDLEHYEATGGMHEALSRHADEIFDAFPSDAHRAAAARLFKALTERGPDGRGIRRPTRLGQLVAIAAVGAPVVREAIESYRVPGVTFLMPPVTSALDDTAVIDISHESLMRVWNRLRGWVEQEAQSARVYRRLHETADLHAEKRAGLYHDPDLQIALSWREGGGPNSAWANQYGGGFDKAMAFLDTSREAAEREEKEREAGRQRELVRARELAETQARAARLFKRFAIGLGAALCLAVALTVWAIMQRQEAKRLEAAANFYADEANTQAMMAETEAQAARKAEQEAKNLATAEAAAKALAQKEKQRADENAKKAEERAGAARKAEAEAKVQLTRAEWLVYAGRLSLAQTDFETGNGSLALQYLDECQWNMRGWEHHYLWTRINAKLTLHHIGPLSSVAFGPDGKRIATGSWGDKLAKVWDAETGKELLTLRHGVAVRSVAFSPDGKRIVTGGGDVGQVNEAKVWDAETGKELLTIKGHAFWVVSVAFSPDNKRIVTGSRSADNAGVARVWDAEKGEELLSLKGHTALVASVAYSADGKRIVTGSYDNTAKVWDAEKGEELLTLKGHTNEVRSVAFSPDGKRIVSASTDSTAKVWDAEKGQELLTFKRQPAWVWSAAFSPDGKRIVSAGTENMVRVWDAETGQEHLTLKGHSQQVVSVAFSPDGKRIVSASADRTARVWDAEGGQQVLSFNGKTGSLRGVAFSPDSTRIATVGGVWDAVTGSELIAFQGTPGPVAFSPDGKRIVTGSQDGTVKVWDAATGREVLSRKGHASQVLSVAFSPDGKRIVSGAGDGHAPGGAKVWDAEKGEELLALNGRVRVWSVAFSPDGKRIVTGDGDIYQPGKVKVWDTATGKEVKAFTGHTNEVWCVAFSPDGKRIVSGGLDRMVRVWDAETGEVILTLTGHTNGVWSVAFSPDGKRIFSGSEDTTMRVWDAGTGQELLAINGNRPVHTVACSRDGQRLAAGMEDGMVKVWVAEKAQLPRNDKERAELWKDRLPGLLRGEYKPADSAERVLLAQLVSNHKKFALATRLWAEALDGDPKLGDDHQAQYRYKAACAAALAAAGEGQGEPPLDETAKARLRRRVLDWLEAERDAWSKPLESGPPSERESGLYRLSGWKRDADLAGIRDAASLAKLPPEERAVFARFWADLAALLKTANATHCVYLQEELAKARKTPPKDTAELAYLLARLGRTYLEQELWAEAEPYLRESLAIREKATPDSWTTFNSYSSLGGVLLGRKKYAEAEPLLLKGYQGMKEREATIPPIGKDRLPEAIDRLIDLYTATNKPDEVKKWQAERAK